MDNFEKIAIYFIITGIILGIISIIFVGISEVVLKKIGIVVVFSIGIICAMWILSKIDNSLNPVEVCYVCGSKDITNECDNCKTTFCDKCSTSNKCSKCDR